MHVFALMNRWMVMVMLALFAALALIVLATSAGSAQEAVSFRVTITNATSPEMTITPGAYLVHSTSDAFWAPGASANLALERIAEIGDPAEAVASLGAVALDAAPAGGDSVVIEFTAAPGDQFSFAQMLIASNDGFIGLASMPLFSGSQPTNGTFALIGWDAGTEANTALFSDFEGGQPDPAQGAANVENGTPTSEPIAAHPQFTGVQATAANRPHRRDHHRSGRPQLHRVDRGRHHLRGVPGREPRGRAGVLAEPRDRDVARGFPDAAGHHPAELPDHPGRRPFRCHGGSDRDRDRSHRPRRSAAPRKPPFGPDGAGAAVFRPLRGLGDLR